MTAGRRPWPTAAVALLLIGLCVVTYLPVFGGAFAWDDHPILRQPGIQHLQPLAHYFDYAAWGRTGEAFFRPLIYYGYALEVAAWGGRAEPMHATNVAIHVLNVLLLLGLGRVLGLGRGAAGLAAAVFAVLPRLSEAVAWISGRTDALATTGVLAGLLLAWGRGGAVGWTGAGLALGIGLFSKEAAAAGLLALTVERVLVAWRAPAPRPWRRIALQLSPSLAVAAVYALARTAFMGGAGLAADPIGYPRRVVLALNTLGAYVESLATPMAPEVIIGVIDVTETHWLGLGGLAVAVAVGGAFWLRRRGVAPRVWALLVWAAAGLALVSHLIPFAAPSVAADRYLYGPMCAFVLLGALGGAQLPWRAQRTTAIVAAALVPLMAMVTYARAGLWQDERALFAQTAATARPYEWYPAYWLMETEARHGDWAAVVAAAARARQAMAELEARGALWPPAYARVVLLESRAWLALGQAQEAARRLEAWLPGAPDDARARATLAVARVQLGDVAGGRQELRRAWALAPHDTLVRDTARMFAELGLVGAAPPATDANAAAETPPSPVDSSRRNGVQ